MPAPDDEDACRPCDSAPCIGCGLCCNGVLHDHVILEEEEAGRMRSLGHEAALIPEKHSLRLPCNYFGCGSCDNYDHRFETCRSYRCALLRRYHAGEFSLDQCRAGVEEAQSLIAKIEESDPGFASHSTRGGRAKALQKSLHTASPKERLSIAERLLNLMALGQLLETEFRHREPRE